MWHSSLDFSFLDQQERQQHHHFLNSTNPDQGLLYTPPPFAARSWYVFLLLDANKEGHTNVVKTTDPSAYRTTTTAAEHTNPDGNPNATTAASNTNDSQAWRVALAIDVGPSEAEADLIISRISTSSNGKKQVRGGVQRGIRGDLVSTWRHKVLFADRAALLGLPAAEVDAQVRTMPYSLTAAAATSHGT